MFIPARNLSITHANDSEKWKWTRTSSSEEVVELLKVHWLEIQANFNLNELQKTSYSAFLVFKLKDSTRNLEKATASVRLTKEITDWKLEEGYVVYLDKRRNHPEDEGRFPQLRDDGWMEIKLGEFSKVSGDQQDEVQIRLREKNTDHKKFGLVVRGIDLRPNFLTVDEDGSSPAVFHDCAPDEWHHLSPNHSCQRRMAYHATMTLLELWNMACHTTHFLLKLGDKLVNGYRHGI